MAQRSSRAIITAALHVTAAGFLIPTCCALDLLGFNLQGMGKRSRSRSRSPSSGSSSSEEAEDDKKRKKEKKKHKKKVCMENFCKCASIDLSDDEICSTRKRRRAKTRIMTWWDFKTTKLPQAHTKGTVRTRLLLLFQQVKAAKKFLKAHLAGADALETAAAEPLPAPTISQDLRIGPDDCKCHLVLRGNIPRSSVATPRSLQG